MKQGTLTFLVGVAVVILLVGTWLFRYSAPVCRDTFVGDPTCFVTDRWTGRVVVKLDEETLETWADARWPAETTTQSPMSMADTLPRSGGQVRAYIDSLNRAAEEDPLERFRRRAVPRP